MQDLRQNKIWARFCESKGWKIETLRSADGQHTLQAIIIPLGMLGLKFLKLQRSEFEPNWQELKRIKRKNWVITSVIEPMQTERWSGLNDAGYRLSRFPYLATKTIIIDITKSVTELWNNLSENTRRLIKKNKDVEIKKVKPELFLKYWKTSAKIWTMSLIELNNIQRILKKKASFYLCYKNNICQSGLLIVETKDMANYMHTFTTEAGRISGAHFKLVWESILESKEKGLKFYDFEGIFDSRWPQKKWKGFTEFKNKFGGNVIEFPGCFSKWF
jgi:lipid II:glycine glycyltransferase (peptidoglycan interpeptide bridge formation enzyme)